MRAERLPLAPSPAGVRERARRRLVGVVLAVYLLAIFEGSLRKYVLPEFGQYIFFVRDPLLLYAYLLALRHGLWPRRSAFVQLSVAMGAIGLLLFVLQSAVGGYSDTRVLLGVYGWRSYFLYVPLAFLIGAQFTSADLLRVAKLTLLVGVPIAALVTLQFFSPMNAPINVGFAADEALQFRGIGLNAERIRPTGPFTSSAGQQQFVATASALLLALWLTPAARRRVATLPLMVAGAALLTCVALGGSRGTTLQCALNGAFAVLIGLIGRGAVLKAKAVLLPLGLGLAAVVLYPMVFPEGFSAFVERWNAAAAAEAGFEGGVFGRALFGFIDFVRLVDDVPALGYGLGYGGNASITLKASVDGVMPGALAETDFARHMVDLGPAFGLAYIGFRLALVVWLGRRVWRATRRVADPMPMMLFAYASYVVLLGQLTGNGTINVYGWLFTGLCIAATNVARAPAVPGPSPAALTSRRPRPPRAPRLSPLRGAAAR
ncbi:MAG TPA: hypothetical protein VLI72_18595 [Methylibium sp.]|nr:hypothetical protein [Methylibium sp.]